MSGTMTALHPSNPYYNLSRHLDTQPQPILKPYAPLDKPLPPPPPVHRSTSLPTNTPYASVSETQQQRKSSITSQNAPAPVYRTRSIGGPFMSGVYFERVMDLSPPNDD